MALILSGTDGVSDVDGSAATPAVRGSDTNTGIFFPAADTIAFAEGGVEVGRFSSTGGLMVGTATDPGAGLIADVAGNVRAIPPSGAARTSSYTLVKADVGDFVEIGSGGSITIPTSVFAAGDAIAMFNNTTGNITITCSAPTVYVSGTNSVRTSLTLATRGVCNVLFITPTLCVITGNVT